MIKIFVCILRMSISASYLIFAVLAVRFLLKKAPKTMRMFLWFLVGIRLLLPFSIESAFCLIPDTQPVSERISQTPQPKAPAPAAIPDLKNPLPAAAPQQEPAEIITDHTPRYLRLAAGIWIAGMAVMAAYMLISWIRLANRVKTAVPVDAAVGNARTVRVYKSERIDSPFLFGVIRPRIYIPEKLAVPDIPYVVLHEEMHRKRKDHLTKLAGFLILSAYWFHPLVWISCILLYRDIELACDEQVIRMLGEPCKKAYSQALLASAVNHRTIAACPVAFGEIGVRERVKNVLHYKKPAFWLILAAALACIAVPVCFMTKPKASPQPEGLSNPKTSSATEAEEPQTEKPADWIREEIERWAQAFCGRDGKTIAKMLEEGAAEELTDKCNFIKFEDGSIEFGFSSPWPWGADGDDALAGENYRIVSLTDSSAVILYYAWVSDPHVTVWREQLTYKTEENRCVITSESIQFMDNICTAEEFEQAYPQQVIAGTMMDYYSYNGAGETLNDTGAAEMLLQPDTAAVYLLNLLNNQNKVSTEVISTDENMCTVTVTFHLPPQKSVDLTMIRPYGTDGIWVPYDRSTADASFVPSASVIEIDNVDDVIESDAETLEALFPDHHLYAQNNDRTQTIDLDGDGIEEKIELTDLNYNGGDGGYALTVTDTRTGEEIPLPDGYTKENGFPITAEYTEPTLHIGLETQDKTAIAEMRGGALLRIYERKGLRAEAKERMYKYGMFDCQIDAVSGFHVITREGENTPTLVLKSYVSGTMGHSDAFGYIITELKLQKDHTFHSNHYFLLDGCEG